MKTAILSLILFLICPFVFAQQAIHDRAIEAQQERMVFKQWDAESFYPRPNRILGVPTNPNWFLTWALHPNYPDTDRRPLSETGSQTQRLALVSAMQISSNYHKDHSDSVRNVAINEITRISGALSATDPLFLLYYSKELKPIDEYETNAFINTPYHVAAYMTTTGSYDWYIERMSILREKYHFAKTFDMERGQRILMYHRILYDMRKTLKSWEYKKKMSEMMLQYMDKIETKRYARTPFQEDKADSEIMQDILNRRKTLQ